MNFPIITIWKSPLSFLGALGVIFIFIPFSDYFSLSKQNSPRWDAAFCGDSSGAILLPMSHRKDVRLKRVKV